MVQQLGDLEYQHERNSHRPTDRYGGLKVVEGNFENTMEVYMMNKTIYLAYGSNLNLEQMAHRCPTAELIGTAVLRDYQLLFRGGHGVAVATVEPCVGESVPVLLWDIQPQDELNLDRYEGVPYLYRKEYRMVEFKGKVIQVMLYIMNEGRPLATPNAYYYTTIREGYKDNDFDEQILKQAVLDSLETDLVE